MAGWSALEALSGYHYNALQEHLTFAPAEQTENMRIPFITATGWGTIEQHTRPTNTARRIIISCAYNEIRLQQLTLAAPPPRDESIFVTASDGTVYEHSVGSSDGKVTLNLMDSITLTAGESLTIAIPGSLN
jgi:hypothetical protein